MNEAAAKVRANVNEAEGIAQLVEQRTETPCVGASILPPAIALKPLATAVNKCRRRISSRLKPIGRSKDQLRGKGEIWQPL